MGHEIKVKDDGYHSDPSNDVVLLYDGFIRKLASRLVAGCPGDLFDDVVSVINMRYLEAIKTFDPSKGKLSTYATRYAILEARRFLDGERRRGMYVPVGKRAITALTVVLSLYLRPSNDEDRGRLSDSSEFDVASPEVTFPVHVDFWDWVKDILNPDEWLIIEMRFRQEMTWRQCGEVLGISHESVRQYVKSILPKLAIGLAQHELGDV